MTRAHKRGQSWVISAAIPKHSYAYNLLVVVFQLKALLLSAGHFNQTWKDGFALNVTLNGYD
ncbi:TPA: hypothetical protein N2332_004608 [Escherichia coli]|nr:hypothetical protein [Escherichia coli]